MVDYSKRLTTELEKILPTYYELFLGEDITYPCITYLPTNNYSYIEGDTMRFSKLSYNIKLWGNDYKQLMSYINTLDLAMKKVGLKRTNYNELCFNGLFQLIFKYEGTGFEIYDDL